MKNKRKVITFCGSSRFKDVFHTVASEYTLMGWIVLMPHCYFENNSRSDLKELLADIHHDMIEMSDAILVINPNKYIGESTSAEIEYARRIGKEIKYLEQPKTNKNKPQTRPMFKDSSWGLQSDPDE